jgi:hypothetical protein
MQTEKLIDLLARDPAPVARATQRRRLAVALVAGGAGALVLMLGYLGIRPDIAAAARTPMFWVKLALPLSLLGIAILATARLARPGVRLGGASVATLVPIALIWILAAVVILGAPPGDRTAMLLGKTWKVCPFNIAVLSIPAFVAAFWVMKGMAPTRPRVAGAFAGLFAGAVGAAIYCLHCPEMAPPFLGTWYLLGMAIPTAAGALTGPRLLRW